ncbi:MAG: hypothetical protein MK213_09215 [Planctomycetes bacterium]|nr:hypothetical protein [Planctomycetota bacterium]
MNSPSKLFAELKEHEGTVVLASPAVGVFRAQVGLGETIQEGSVMGILTILGHPHPLFAPNGFDGICSEAVTSKAVDCGATLFAVKTVELEPLEGNADSSTTEESEHCFLAPQSGKFWRRPAPDAPNSVEEGDILQPNKTLGLLEVMKTFTPLKFDGTSPATALRFRAADGEDVQEGQGLLDWAPLDA